MNAERLAFADGSFDKAIVSFGVAGLPDAVRAMHELQRVCRPGARIVVSGRSRIGAAWSPANPGAFVFPAAGESLFFAAINHCAIARRFAIQ